jgi:hypothetical protein
MLSVPAPTPPPVLPPVRTTDPRPGVEPDEQWKDDLRKRIEHGLRGMVEDAQTVRDTILSSQPSESSRERAQLEYEKSMNAIRTLAQDEFNRQFRLEMSERKWALNVVDSNSPDVVRQQQWILDNIHKAEEQRIPFGSPDASHNAAGVLSSSPRQEGHGEHGSERFEDGSEEFGDAGSDDEGGASGDSRESEEEDDDDDDDDEDDDDEEEEEEEEDSKPRQSRPPSRPNVPLAQNLHSMSPVSRRNAPSRQRQQSNSRRPPAEDNDEGDVDDSYAHSPLRGGSQPYPTGAAPLRQSSGSHAPPWRTHPRPPEPSGISRTLAHANGQIYSGSPVPFPRRGSVNSTGSNSSGAGLHRAGSLNSDQYRSSSGAPPHAPSGAERPSTQIRDRIVANIPSRERQTSASASPHDQPSPPTHSIASPRAIPGARPPSFDESMRSPMSASPSSRAIYGPLRSPEDVRQGIAIPRGHASPDDGRIASWGSSLHSRRSLTDFSVHRRHNSKGDSRLPTVDGEYSDESEVVGPLDDRQSMHSFRSMRSVRSVDFEMILLREAEARRKEEEAARKEEDANKKEEEARRLEEKARQSMEEAARLGTDARQAEASAKMREAAAQTKEAEAKRKEAEAKKREANAEKREAEAQRKEEEARRREHEARRKEEQARRKEEDAQRKEEEARRREEEFRRKEEDARKREEDARRREEDARQLEIVARQKEDEARRFEEQLRKKEKEARLKEEEARRTGEDFERKRQEVERREAELRKREAELSLKEEAARLAQEEPARLAQEEAARQAEEKAEPSTEATRQAEEAANADEANRFAEEFARQAPETETAGAEQERQTKGQGRKGSKAQARRKKERELEQRLEEERRLKEQQHLEVEMQREEERLRREREEQIRLDEELSRQEQERLDREALLEQERLLVEAQEREANRIREEQLRAVEEERLRHFEDQRRKATEQHRQQQHHLQEEFKQRAKEEQEREFQRREAQYYQRTLERERQNSIGASDSWTPHRPNLPAGSASDRSSASSTFSSSTGSTFSSRPTSMASPHTTSSFTPSSPLSTTPRPSPTSARPGAPGTSPHATRLDEAEWARRAEERARQQQEQFKREQERLESERQAKSAKVLSREDLIRLFDSHENKWRRLKESDNLRWNNFAWPVFKHPSEPEEMTTSAIGAYVLSRYAPDASSKNSKDRIKDHIKRWHPDKFETRILPRVAEEEREKVKAGAGFVVRGLNELLSRNYDD